MLSKKNLYLISLLTFTEEGSGMMGIKLNALTLSLSHT